MSKRIKKIIEETKQENDIEVRKFWRKNIESKYSDVQPTWHAYEHIKSLQHRLYLEIKGIHLRNKDMKYLCEEELWTERLEIVDATVKDNSLKHLKKMPHLKALNITDTNITDASVKHIAATKIYCLILRNTAITREGVNELIELMPECYINFDGECLSEVKKMPVFWF